MLCLAGFISFGILVFGHALDSKIRKQPGMVIKSRYPGCHFKKSHLNLNTNQRQEIKKQARVGFVGSRYIWYKITCPGKKGIYAVKDSHRVRSRKETIFTFVDDNQTVLGVEIVEFFEPIDYMAPERWLKLLQGKNIKDPLQPGNDLSGISGATMTSYAISSAVRRSLYLQPLFRLYSYNR